mgnify:CR=1 FL=1
MATTPYTGYTSSDKPATVTTTPDYASQIPKEDLASFQKANPGLTFDAQEYAHYNDPNSYVYKMPSPTVDATKIGTTAPIKLPTPSPYDVGNYTSAIKTTAGSIEAQTNAALAEQQAQQKLAQAQAGSNDIATLQAQIGGKAADTANLYQSSGVNTAYNQLQDLNAQATGLKNEASAIPIANRLQAQTLGTAGTENQVQNVNYDQLQKNALKALSLGQQAAIAESNYNKAKNLADQQVEIKYGQMEADLKAKQTQLDALNKYQLTPAQEKAKSALERQYKLQDQELADKKAQEKEINTLIVEASQFAPKDILAKAQAIKDNGGSSTEVAMALGQYGKDFLKNQLLREQLKTEQAQRAKIYADIGKTSGEQTGTISSATDLQKATANLKLTDTQSKALAFGQRAINADVALRKRLETYDPTTIFSATGRLLNTDNARAFERDLGDFITAVLRKESGATITQDEFDRFIPLYSPQGIMTNQTDVTQTNFKRSGAIDALIAEAGPASAALSAYKNSGGQATTEKFVVPQGVSSAGASYAQSTMGIVGNVNNQVNTQQSYSGYDTGIKE